MDSNLNEAMHGVTAIPSGHDELHEIDRHRLAGRILSRWFDHREGRKFPMLRDFDVASLGEDWSSCFLLDTCEDRVPPRRLHVGRKLRRRGLLDRAMSRLQRVVTEERPLLIEGVPARTSIEPRRTFRMVMVPLSEDGVRIDHVLGAVG